MYAHDRWGTESMAEGLRPGTGVTLRWWKYHPSMVDFSQLQPWSCPHNCQNMGSRIPFPRIRCCFCDIGEEALTSCNTLLSEPSELPKLLSYVKEWYFCWEKKCLYSIYWRFKAVVWRVGSKTPGEATWSFAVASLQHSQSRNLSRHPESWFRLWLFPFMLSISPSALILRLTCQHSWRAGGERDRGALPPKDEWWGAAANRDGKCEWGNYVLLKRM